MQITIPRGELKTAVGGFSKIVNGKTTLPVLGCVRFESGGHGITAQVTDLDQTLRYKFGEAQAHGDGAFIVPLASLKEMAKGGEGETIEFEAGENNTVAITNHVGAHAVKHPLSGMDPDDWPVGPSDVPTKPAEGFLDTYRRLVPFASTDRTRYVLNAVYVEVAEKGEHPVTMIATDGRRMTCRNTMNLPLASSVIVPATKFLSWTGLQGEAGIGLRTEKRKKELQVLGFALSVGPWFYDVRAIDGTYPNWRQIVPSAYDSDATLITFTDEDAQALRKIIPGFPGSGADSTCIALRPGKDGRLVIAGRGEKDQTDTTLELTGGSTFAGKLPGVGVDRFFLLDALSAGFRTFATADELCPLRADDGKGAIHVLMPMRLGTEPVKKVEAAQAEGAKPESGKPPAQQQPATGAGTPAETTPPQADHKPKGEQKVMKNEGGTPGSAEQGTALDRLQAAYEVAKAKVREANQALADVAGAIKDAAKENRQLRADVDSVRSGLAKLQSIKV